MGEKLRDNLDRVSELREFAFEQFDDKVVQLTWFDIKISLHCLEQYKLTGDVAWIDTLDELFFGVVDTKLRSKQGRDAYFANQRLRESESKKD